MTERPILFSGPMVRAILEGRKTQTRRLVKWRAASPADVSAARPPDEASMRVCSDSRAVAWGVWREDRGVSMTGTPCPYGSPGDTLWVRETWQATHVEHLRTPREYTLGGTWGTPAFTETPCVVYRADGDRVAAPEGRETARWAPSIHMPRWASRLTLRVVSVRVERLRSITEEDARAEGVDPDPHPLSAAAWGGPHRLAFGRLWDSINGKRAPWGSNPWVWVVGFSRLEVS